MKKTLIIGCNAFVASHLVNEFRKNNYECIGVDCSQPVNKESFKEFYVADILKEDEVFDVVSKVKPDYIVNLVAISSVKKSWEIPAITFDVNVKGTINILESVRKLGLNARLLLIGSSEQYGKIDYSKPVSEETNPNPVNPYAISKVAQENIALMYNQAYGMDIILVRSFNHIGPGQSLGFVTSDFASQLVKIEQGKCDPILSVGNLSAKRDFTDVRDIVKAYRLLLENGKSGQIYNVGSGKAISIEDMLEILMKNCNADIKVCIDKNRFRAIDTPVIVCDNKKMVQITGWKQSYCLEESLKDILEYWRNKIGG